VSKEKSIEEWAPRARLEEIEAAAAELVEVGDLLFRSGQPADPALLFPRSAFCPRLFLWRCCTARDLALRADLLGETRGVNASVELLGIFRGFRLLEPFLALGHCGLLSDDCNPGRADRARGMYSLLSIGHSDPNLIGASCGVLASTFPERMALTSLIIRLRCSYFAATSHRQPRGARERRAHKMNTIPQRRRDLARPHAMHRPQTTGDARQRYERYLTRAREAQIAGDAIEMENFYQHAEHYLRVMRGEGHERRDRL
jgi:hypothetical protein